MKDIKSPRITSHDLQLRYEQIKNGLKIEDEELMKMLMDTISYDEQGIAIILKLEGSIYRIKKYYEDIKRLYLSRLKIKDIYKYKNIPEDKWDFLTSKERANLINIFSFIKIQKREYMLARADLMIMRKAVIDFVDNYIRKNNIKNVPTNIINNIINNYTYKDTLWNLGFSVEHTSVHNEVEMKKLALDSNLRYSI